jgi:tetratricopeptide (TPR) repeat protein
LAALAVVAVPVVVVAAPKLAVRKPTAESSPKAKPPASPRPPAADDLYEGPAVPKPAKPPAGKLPEENRVEAPLSPGPKYADAWPSEKRKAERDLELTREADNRALAIAAFAEGQMADEKGDPDKALEAWKRATELDPANADLAVKVAFELARRNDPAEAIRVLKDSIAAAPKEPQTYIYLSQVYAKHLDKPELAMQAAQKAMEVAPDHFPAWAAVYELHEQAGDKKKAGDLLESALKNPTKNSAFWLQLGGYLRKVFLKDDGTATPEELRQMEIAFRKASEIKPGDASVLTQVADFFVLARRNKEALEFYERAVKLNQPARDEGTKNLREKYIRALVANDRKAEAIPLLEQFARDPTQSLRNDLFELLGELYEQSGQTDKALDHFKHSLVLDTSTPTNHFNLANMQMRAKRFADAIETMEKARMRFRDRPDVTLGLALALSAAKRHADSLAMFARVVQEAKGRNEALLDSEFYFKWGAAAEQAGQIDRAAELLRKSIGLDPDTPEAYNYLGYMWVDKGMNVEEAGTLIKRAVEMSPDNGAYLDSLGWYYFKAGKFEDAKKQLLAALDKLTEEDPVVFEHLADACEELGQHAEAINYWERALKLKPDAPEKIQQKIDAARQKQAGAK